MFSSHGGHLTNAMYHHNQQVILSGHPIPDSLWRSPLCHTLSKALLMSQKAVRTSLTLSTALQNVR